MIFDDNVYDISMGNEKKYTEFWYGTQKTWIFLCYKSNFSVIIFDDNVYDICMCNKKKGRLKTTECYIGLYVYTHTVQ